MAQVVIRNIDDGVVERLKARAAAKRPSLEQTLREILTAPTLILAEVCNAAWKRLGAAKPRSVI